jgi:hypothetical protein
MDYDDLTIEAHELVRRERRQLFVGARQLAKAVTPRRPARLEIRRLPCEPSQRWLW